MTMWYCLEFLKGTQRAKMEGSDEGERRQEEGEPAGEQEVEERRGSCQLIQ